MTTMRIVLSWQTVFSSGLEACLLLVACMQEQMIGTEGKLRQGTGLSIVNWPKLVLFRARFRFLFQTIGSEELGIDCDFHSWIQVFPTMRPIPLNNRFFLLLLLRWISAFNFAALTLLTDIHQLKMYDPTTCYSDFRWRAVLHTVAFAVGDDSSMIADVAVLA